MNELPARSDLTIAQRQAALLRLSAELAAAADEDTIYRRVVDGLQETLGYDNVALVFLVESTGERVSVASVGYVDSASAVSFAPGDGLSDRPLEDGQLHYTPDVSQESRYVPGLGGAEVDVPIRVGGEVLGVLVAESRRLDAFDHNDLDVLMAAAQQVGVAIDKARLLAEERRRADTLEALRTTLADITAELDLPVLLQAIVERAVGLLDASGGELGLYEAETREVRVVVCHNLGWDFAGARHRFGEGVMGRVAETGEALIVADYVAWDRRDPRYEAVSAHAAMAAPLNVGDRLVGVITVGTVDKERKFGYADVHILNLFAQQAAIAIENARLLASERKRVDELDALRRTLTDITAELELPTLLRAIVERSVRLLEEEVTFGELGFYDPDGQEIEVVVSHNLDRNYVGTRHPLGVGIMGHVAATEEPVIIDDYQVWQGRAPEYARLAAHAAIAAPLMVGLRLVGVITIADRDPERRFQPDDLRLLELFARQAAIAIENARLYQQAQRAAVVEERSRLARELHDSVTQSLYSLTLVAETAQRWAKTGDLGRVADYCQRIGEIGQQALREMRLLVYQLRPLALENVGLVGAVQQRLDAVERRAGVQAHMLVEGEPDLPAAVEEALFRICQEALNNALKHAAPTLVTVSIQEKAEQPGDAARFEVELSVTDDGQGFDPDSVRDSGGMGLTSMRERTVALGGTLRIHSIPGKGTTVIAVVPTSASTTAAI